MSKSMGNKIAAIYLRGSAEGAGKNVFTQRARQPTASTSASEGFRVVIAKIDVAADQTLG